MLKRKQYDDDGAWDIANPSAKKHLSTNVQVQSKSIGIANPKVNDVLCGRGDGINRRPGNQHFRKLVNQQKRVYSDSQFKREKRMIAASIVSAIRDLDPPGRFISKDPKNGLWYDIGDERAREKTSQALREKPRIGPRGGNEIDSQNNGFVESGLYDHPDSRKCSPQMLQSSHSPSQSQTSTWDTYNHDGHGQIVQQAQQSLAAEQKETLHTMIRSSCHNSIPFTTSHPPPYTFIFKQNETQNQANSGRYSRERISRDDSNESSCMPLTPLHNHTKEMVCFNTVGQMEADNILQTPSSQGSSMIDHSSVNDPFIDSPDSKFVFQELMAESPSASTNPLFHRMQSQQEQHIQQQSQWLRRGSLTYSNNNSDYTKWQQREEKVATTIHEGCFPHSTRNFQTSTRKSIYPGPQNFHFTLLDDKPTNSRIEDTDTSAHHLNNPRNIPILTMHPVHSVALHPRNNNTHDVLFAQNRNQDTSHDGKENQNMMLY